MNADYIFWTFSAAAQSISALIAFLLTGYTLVHTLMEAGRGRDDSLEEVHVELKRQYHQRLTLLVWLTGFAIITSLLIVYFNRSNAPAATWAILLVSLIDLAAIVFGVMFVLSIVDPAKYQKAAKQALQQAPGNVRSKTAPAADFFEKFIHLERVIRDYLRKQNLYIPSRGSPQMSYSFRQMIEALFHNERINHNLFSELLEISKYRNLVFHGHVSSVEEAMLQRIQSATDEILKIPDTGAMPLS